MYGYFLNILVVSVASQREPIGGQRASGIWVLESLRRDTHHVVCPLREHPSQEIIWVAQRKSSLALYLALCNIANQ